MTPRHFHYILATAGHVDHGKSALVKSLTGTDPDRLPEEKTRGITIDLGFAHLDLTAEQPSDPPGVYHLGVVDVPGHEDFVKNMVAGVGAIDLALLAVAADDGWMPQTEEHLQILTYVGVTRAVVALTKTDLASGHELAAVARVRHQLEHSPFPDAPIVPTSVLTNRGIGDLKAALLGVLRHTPPPRDIHKPRLPVDRVFTLKGIGTVITGTLHGGMLQRGQTVAIQPAGRMARLRNLQRHNTDVEHCQPGMRTAVSLPDVEARSEAHPDGVDRGDVITLAELGGGSDTMDVLLEKSARSYVADAERGALAGGCQPARPSGTNRPLKDGLVVQYHHGSGHAAARVLLLSQNALEPGQRALAQLRFEKPVFAFAGDRFILRDWSEQTTLAGGLVLDPDATRRGWRGDGQRLFLERRAQSPEDLLVFITTQLARDHMTPRASLLLKSRFASEAVADAVSALLKRNEAVAAGDLVLDVRWWEALRQRAIAAIEAEHRAHPERSGLPVTDLRAALGERLPAGIFEALTENLTRDGFQQVGTCFRRTTHRQALPPALEAAGMKMRAALSLKPMEPPSRKELAPDILHQKALRFLIDTGEAVEISADIVLSAEAYHRAVGAIIDHMRQRGAATVSDLRQLVGSSRRIMVPLLEKLDRDGITRRQGDVRIPGPKTSQGRS